MRAGRLGQKAAWEYVFLIDDNGTAANPITFRAYGTGEKPTFSNGGNKYNKGIKITADYVIIEDIMVSNTGYDAFELTAEADNNIIRNCEIAFCGIGVHCTGSNNLFTRNYIHDLIMIVDDTGTNCSLPKTNPLWTRNPCDNDYGCVSFWLYGPNNEISYNRSINNIGHSYDYQYDGGFIELYSNSDNTYVHHNWVETGMGIVEASNGTGNNVRFVYNVFIENKGFFALHLTNFTTTSFKLDNNTCITKNGTLWNNMFNLYSGDQLTNKLFVRNNVFLLGGDAGERVAQTNNFTHSNNLYYLLDGAQMGSVALGTGEKTGDPKFVDLVNKNFKLQAGSPAIDAGLNLGYTLDYYGNVLTSGSMPDMAHLNMAQLRIFFNKDTKTTFDMYPNPATNNVTLNITATQDQKMTLSVFNILGQPVFNTTYVATVDGINTFPLKIDLSKGAYLMQITNGKTRQTKNFDD